MLRDTNEWRSPWVDGAAGLPARDASPEAVHGSSPAWLRDGATEPAGDLAAAPGASERYGSMQPSGLTPTSAPLPWLSGPEVAAGASVGIDAAGARPGPRERSRRSGLLAGIVGGIVGAGLMLGMLSVLDVVDLGASSVTSITSGAPDGASTVDRGTEARPPSTLGPTAAVIPDMADRVLPTVVRINVSGSVNLTEANALGSGVIYRSDGYIITNHHVIEGAAAVEVLLANGDRLEADIVGSDPLNDLAVLRVARDGLPVIDLRPSDERLRVGETVVAIGSPFGLDATVTSGIISALNRDLRVPGSADVIPAVIQTDAAINPGNSGGALVDLEGRLVGINTAIISRSGANEGVGFAVSVEQAISSSDQLIAQGFVRYPLLGITGTDVSAAVAEAFGLDNRRGAVVDGVQPGSAAADGGMRIGDLIVAVDGNPLRSMSDLVAEVRRRTPGETVIFDVRRGSGELRLEVVLGERPRS